MGETEFDRRVAAVRAFNRFYTREIGVLRRRFLDSPYSLAELRVLYEIAHRDLPTASDIARSLDIDPGYLSRVLKSFEKKNLIARTASERDARQSHLKLTARGRSAFEPLDRKQQQVTGAMLERLSEHDQLRLIKAMRTIETLIKGEGETPRAYVLRPHRAGDMGWVVARHGVLYAQEYGWDSRIEAITAEIVSAFLKNFDPARERCWIAEMDGEPVGSVFLVRETDEVARLRLLLVEPHARGFGIGRRLVEECIDFARAAGYRRITLWTHRVLEAARAIYERAGFTLTKEWVHDEFGKPEVSETWDLVL